MKVLKVVWGLLFDDARLVIVLFIALCCAGVLSYLGQHVLAAALIWIGLFAALTVSIEHQLRLRR